jgi:tetratricopeptide (TPR) repeat protein
MADILHERAQHFRKIGNHDEALENAVKAVDCWRKLVGCEDHLMASLHLAAIEAKALGRIDQSEEFRREAWDIGNKLEDPRTLLGEKLIGLFDNFDEKAAEVLAEQAEQAGDNELLAGVRVLQATSDKSLQLSQRLRILEVSLQDIPEGKAREPVQMALATELMNEKLCSRAIKWLRRILAANPLSSWARDALVQCFWETDDWGEAVIFLETQINQFGEMPGLLTAYGKSLLEAGDVSSAIPPLTRAMELFENGSDSHKGANALRERALNLGGTLLSSPSPPKESSLPLTKKELEEALQDFSKFIAAEKRMVFWSKPKGAKDYSWISKPEQTGQNLLHTFLKARFGQRVSVFEELSIGAGRMDILIQSAGGLSVILELKMCGFNYPSSYAASGEEQIFHYMENKDIYLGYLVVFDSRLEIYGEKLIKNGCRDSFTVSELFVDVRPRVSSRKKPKAV